MKVILTGSGGADGIPGFYADSNLSRHALANGGKDIRTRTGAVINDHLKIDFGPDTFVQSAQLGLSPMDWKWVVYTHSHYDHYAPHQLQYAFPPFVPAGTPTPVIFGNEAIVNGFTGTFDLESQLEKHLIKSFETYEVGPYSVTAIKAYHKLDEDSLNLIIQRDGKTLLYALDTGIYQEETWQFLKGWTFDAAVIECTDGFNPTDYWGHLSCAELLSVLERMRDIGCVTPTTYICTSHHSHSGLATHAELEAFLTPHNIEVGFDGKSFSF